MAIFENIIIALYSSSASVGVLYTKKIFKKQLLFKKNANYLTKQR